MKLIIKRTTLISALIPLRGIMLAGLLGGCSNMIQVPPTTLASSDEGGYYMDHASVAAVGGVGNYAFKPGMNGPTGHPLAHGQLATSRYLDQTTTQQEGGIGNYVLPGDRVEMAGTVASENAGPRFVSDPEVMSTLSKLNDELVFDEGQAELKPAAQKDLEKLASLLSNQKSDGVRVRGYTDSTGSSEFNDALSKRRARAVAEVLIQNGLSSDRVVANGFGERFGGNDSFKGREDNRRADVLVVSIAS